ncbi:MAG: hypothetical protein CMP21_08685 [Rickettsiales bacterium]|nr:hypothetical protein [Rickettsiales bacterium]|tara:strand:+ start:3452 stop:4207 length:756 start_codon:yes stop_codon:yes gene_type:complete
MSRRAIKLIFFYYFFQILLVFGYSFIFLVQIFNSKWAFSMKHGLVHRFCKILFPIINVKIDCNISYEKLKKVLSKPLVMYSNHQSIFDAYLLYSILPVDYKMFWSDTAHVDRYKLSITKLIGKLYDLNFTHYKNNKRKNYFEFKKVLSFISSGNAVLIFPEGSLSKSGKLKPFLPASFQIPLKINANIFGLFIKGSNKIMSNLNTNADSRVEVKIVDFTDKFYNEISSPKHIPKKMESFFMKEYERMELAS